MPSLTGNSATASSSIVLAAATLLILGSNLLTSAHAKDFNPLDLWKLNVVNQFPLRRLAEMTYCESLDVAFVSGGMNTGTRNLQSGSRDLVYDFTTTREVTLEEGSPLPPNSIKPMLFELKHLSTADSCVLMMGGGVPRETNGASGFSALPGPISVWVGELYRNVKGVKDSSLSIRWSELTSKSSSLGIQPDNGPINRLFFTATSLNNATYLYGGVHDTATLSSEMWKLEIDNSNSTDSPIPYSATWTALHKPSSEVIIPGVRVFASMTAMPERNSLVLSGGWLNNNLQSGREDETQSNLVWSYSIASGKWTIERSPSGEALEFARYRHTLISYNDKLFMIGGYMGLSQRQIAPSGLLQSSLGTDPLLDCGGDDKGLWCTYPTFDDYFNIGDGVDTCIMRNSEMVCLMASTNAVSSINLADIPNDSWKKAEEDLPDFAWYPFGMRVTPLFIGVTGVMLYVCLSSLRRMNRHGRRNRAAAEAGGAGTNSGIEMGEVNAGADPDVIANLPIVKYNAKEAQSFWHAQQQDVVIDVEGTQSGPQEGTQGDGNNPNGTGVDGRGTQNVPQEVLNTQSATQGEKTTPNGTYTAVASDPMVGNGYGASSPYEYKSFGPNMYHNSNSNQTASADDVGLNGVQLNDVNSAQNTDTSAADVTSTYATENGTAPVASTIISGGSDGSLEDVTSVSNGSIGGGNGSIGVGGELGGVTSGSNGGDNGTIGHSHSSSSGVLRTRSSTLVQEDCCSICLVEFEAEESLRQLPCGHLYHPECVDVWLLGNASCPLCKASILRPPATGTRSPTAAGVALPDMGIGTYASANQNENADAADLV